MIGKYHIVVHNKFKKIHYEFDIKRKITVLTGFSATGKTTLCESFGDSAYTKSCELVDNEDSKLRDAYDGKARFITVHVDNFYDYFKRSGNILILDDEFISTLLNGYTSDSGDFIDDYESTVNFINERKKYFNETENLNISYSDILTLEDILRFSDNYFILVTRQYNIKYDYLFRNNTYGELLYSVNEIYELDDKPKTNIIVNRYNYIHIDFDKIYSNYIKTLVITEDSKSGFNFLSIMMKSLHVNVISAGGKDNIIKIFNGTMKLKGINLSDYKIIIIIADGAAYGSSIDELQMITACYSKINSCTIRIFMPESFEYLLLKSLLFNDKNTLNNATLHTNVNWDDIEWYAERVNRPYNYYNTDSKYYYLFGSWERYYEDLLKLYTYKAKYQYTKNLTVSRISYYTTYTNKTYETILCDTLLEQKIVINIKGNKQIKSEFTNFMG